MIARLPWFAFLLALVAASHAAQPAPTVILISIDGLPADYFAEPAADLSTLRMMAAGGARAERMTPVFPTVTWPNHTSMVTGTTPARHGVIGNLYYDREARREVALIWDPTFDKEQIVRGPTVYDAAHLAGLKTAGIAWPGARSAAHLDWQVPCVIEADLVRRYTTPSLLAALADTGISAEKIAEASKPDGGNPVLWDWINVQATRHILLTHRPNLLLLHLEAVDSFEHRYGRNSLEAYWASHTADRHVADVIEAVRAAGLAEQTTFFVVSDHGFRNHTKQINANAVLRTAGLIKTAGGRIVESRAYALSASGSAAIYLLESPDRSTTAHELAEEFRAVEGVEAVIEPDGFAQLGLPRVTSDPHAPDLVLAAAEGYVFSKNVVAEEAITPLPAAKGAHGHLPGSEKLGATFIAWGATIRPGVTLPEMRTIDVAPTIAAVLGVKLPTAEGRVLTEILR